MYHVYENGYNVLPGLFALGHDFGHGDIDKKLFQIDEDFKFYQAVKLNSLDCQTCVATSKELSNENKDYIAKFIAKQLSEEYPQIGNLPTNLEGLALKVQEDIAVFDATKDRLLYGHICMPSGWDVLEKIDKNFREIHEVVPGMNLEKMDGLRRAMLNNGPFVRFVWSVVFEKRLNFHPSIPKKEFNSSKPEIYVKVERQVTKGFPEKGLVLFLIRQYLIPEEELNISKLIASLESMTPEQKKYKAIDNSFEDLLAYLKDKKGEL